MLESLLNSEYCEIFKSTYFEKHLRTAASEHMFIKLRKENAHKKFQGLRVPLKNEKFKNKFLLVHGVAI